MDASKDEHTPAQQAAAHLAELRARAVAIRNCRFLTPSARTRMRFELAAELVVATRRFHAAADVPMAGPELSADRGTPHRK